MQAHDLHQHLVGVGGAVEGAGAGAVIGLRSRPRAAPRASPCLRHRAGGPSTSRRWAGRSSSGRRARTPPADGRRSAPRSPAPARSCRRRRDRRRRRTCRATAPTAAASAMTSRENSDSSMPGWPWVTPSHMAGTPPATCAVPPAARAASLDQVGKRLERLMRREHVVVGGDDADVAGPPGRQRLLLMRRTGGRRHARGFRKSSVARCGPFVMRARHAAHIVRAHRPAALANARAVASFEFGSQCHGRLLAPSRRAAVPSPVAQASSSSQRRPSICMRRSASSGPELPAS